MNVSLLSDEDDGVAQLKINMADSRLQEDGDFKKPCDQISKLNETRPFEFKDGRQNTSAFFGNTSINFN